MSVELKRRLFTVEEYHAMARAGVFDGDDRVELIEGEILEVAAIGSRHAACVKRLNRLFSQRIGEHALLGVQDPVRLSDLSEPELDLSLLRPRGDFYAGSHPTPDDVLLLVEVADASLGTDRQVKIPLYARAGVREVWLVDLGDASRQGSVEVFRSPTPDGYVDGRTVEWGTTLRPHKLPGIEIPFRGILGSATP